MSINRAVVDFSAFYDGDKNVIVKELSIIDVDSKSVLHWVFKSPKEQFDLTYGGIEGRNNKWLTKHYHGLDMEEGITEYSSLTTALDYICCSVSVLYAATPEKARTLEHIMDRRRSVISLDLLGCPPLTMMNGKHQCLLHHINAPKIYCTLDSVTNLANWCCENLHLLNLHLPHVRVKTFRDWKCTKPSPKELAIKDLFIVPLKET